LSQRIDEILSSTLLGRLDEATAYLQLFRAHVLFGAPYDQPVFFSSLFEGDLNTGTVINPHNVLAFLLARQGLIGVTLLTMSIIYFYRFLTRNNTTSSFSIKKTYWLTSAAALIAYNATSTSYTSPSFALTVLITLMLSTTSDTNQYPTLA
jgi:hypothetical protein